MKPPPVRLAVFSYFFFEFLDLGLSCRRVEFFPEDVLKEFFLEDF